MGAKKWSMTDLAAASGIDPSAISKLFAGRFPSAIIAKKLLTAFQDGEKLEIAVAWLNDTAELIGIDPTRLTIGVGNMEIDPLEQSRARMVGLSLLSLEPRITK